MKVAIIDDPKCCFGCPFEDSHYSRHYCNYAEKHIEDCDVEKEIAEWCPLRDMPEKRKCEDWFGRYELGLSNGYNECIDDIWGEE